MNSNEKVLRFANDIYTENREMLAIYNAENKEISVINNATSRAFLNNFVKSCDVEGIRDWERIYDIVADEIVETLEFRQERILNRLTTQPPYTKIYLKQMLERIFGAENIILKITNETYIIYIAIETENSELFNDTIQTIKRLVPANMIIEQIKIDKYMHMYLNKRFTHLQMEELTYGELSQYTEVE